MKTSQNPYLVVDAGNTNIKTCTISDDEISVVEIFNELEEVLIRVRNQDLILISVVNPLVKEKLQNVCKTLYEIKYNVKMPFSSAYNSMNTVGVDRLCNVSGMLKYAKNKNALAIDIGTCIKFDFLTADAVYKGGSISPGIQLRYKSLNDYTNNLPLLEQVNHSSLIGNDTNNSIISGVLNGMNAEIRGMISRYEAEYGPLDIYLTGGDALYFDIPQKNNIFAVKNLTILGAVEIYKLNAL
ncbi:MAG: type III pantothenate kinase [Crocinitomicaceae bacterium]|nr:type III pantothenate kinase [Crocinitomicaceae bacterium]